MFGNCATWIYNEIKRRDKEMSNLPEPQTRQEQYLANAAGMDINRPEKPITREEQYLEAVCEAIEEGGGGGGGTTDYTKLKNKPSINNVTLTGNKSADDLGLATDATMTGATSSANGAKGLVPAPASAEREKYLRGDGTWATPQGGGGTSDYTDLTNKPQINGHTLSGNQSAADLGIKENAQGDWNESDSEDPAYIKNKPTIPAAQVNADWEAESGAAQILNKPTIPDPQIQSDWEQSNSSAKDFIKNKPTIPEAIQVAEMPTAAAGYAGRLYQFIGTTGGGYTHGYFYECTEEGGVYSWTQTNTQPAGGGSAVQSDWDESDPNEDDYIKNKPALGDVAGEDKAAAADMSEIITPLPGVAVRMPILLDETGAEAIVGWYRFANGTKKPIYEKTISANMPSNITDKSAGTETTPHNIANVDAIFSTYAVGEENESIWGSGTQIYFVASAADETNVYLRSNRSTMAGKPYKVRIQYTKTTDTANS